MHMIAKKMVVADVWPLGNAASLRAIHGVHRSGPCHEEFDKQVGAGTKQRHAHGQHSFPSAYLSPKEKCQGYRNDYE